MIVCEFKKQILTYRIIFQPEWQSLIHVLVNNLNNKTNLQKNVMAKYKSSVCYITMMS